jgi:hypothetical protein
LIVSGTLVAMEFGPPERRPTYIGIVNTAVGLVSFTSPMIAAGLASIGYGLLFALCVCVGFLAWIAMRFWVQEPRRATNNSVNSNAS